MTKFPHESKEHQPSPGEIISRRYLLTAVTAQAGAIAILSPSLAQAAPLAGDQADASGQRDSSASLARAGQAGPVTLGPGTYRIDASINIAHHLSFLPGARLRLAAGVTVTLAGGLSAAPLQIFEGPGGITFPTGAAPLEGYPEWWGARTNDGNADNRAAFTACLQACPLMRLHNADYFFHDTWVANVSYRTIRGHYGDYSDTGRGTRLVLTGPAAHTAPQLIAGTWPVPASQTQAIWFLRIEDIAIIRDAGLYPVTPPEPRDDYRCVAGVIFGGVVHSGLSRVHVAESQVGIWAHGAVHSTLDDCIVVRSIKGNGHNPSEDTFIGYLFGGPRPNYGFIGANASIYARRCLATGNNALTDTIGVLLKDFLGDTFLTDIETALLATGIRIDGGGRTNQEVAQDVSIHHPILDSCSFASLDLRNLNSMGSIGISDPYMAVTGSGTAVRLDNSAASVTITGGQVLGANGTAGLKARGSSGFDVQGLRIRDCSQPMILQDSAAFRLSPAIINNQVAAGAAIAAGGRIFDGWISPILRATGQRYGTGIALSGNGFERLECHLSSIAVDALAGPKLSWNGTPVKTSNFGRECLATGVLSG